MENNPLISIIIPAKDASLYIEHCLKSIKNQTYQNIEVIIFNNASHDDTIELVSKIYPNAIIINSDTNYFVSGAFNRAFKEAHGKYSMLLCADVILKEDFLEKAVEICEHDKKIGALQAKILKFELSKDAPIKTNIIDTTGFTISKSSRIVNRGHGTEDKNQYLSGEVFSYEGAAGFFRSETLKEVSANNQVLDEDFGWMADDIDLGWRILNYGWKNYYSNEVICWHDRKTTKRLSTGKIDFIKERKKIPAKKRKLDFQNIILTIYKNMFWGNFWRNAPRIILRQVALALYILILEPKSIPAFIGIIKLMPKMTKKRRKIMADAKINYKNIEPWLI